MTGRAADVVRPRILCVGAYERDNFGDLLFQLVTAEYLKDADVVFAAPFAADMSALTGERIPAFGPLLASERFDAVWTVGGEVGATTVGFAHKAALGAEEHARYKAASPVERRRLLAEHMGPVPVESPYLPRVSSYPLNRTAASVVNSVGVAAIAGLPPVRRASVTGILREATFVSVRDRMASETLDAAGIPHSLVPDLVHTIALSRPRSAPRGDYVLLQIADNRLKRFPLDDVIRAIVDSRVLREHPIRLFLAGTAPLHDSVETYERIIAGVRAADPSRRIEISTTRDPWDRVDEIAGAHAWVGSSLHGRIVASAYGVPRVSIAKRKLDEYAQTWDPDMPWGVSPAGLDDALVKAVRAVERGRADVGADLARRAHENMLAAVQHVRDRAATGPAPDRLAQIIAARDLQWQQLADAFPPDEKSDDVASRLPFARRVRRRLGRIARGVLRRG